MYKYFTASLPVIVPNASTYPVDQSKFSPLLALSTPAEPDAAGHWFFGTDYPSFTDLLTGTTLTVHGTSPTNSSHYTSLAVGDNSLVSPFDDQLDQTLCCVVKQQTFPSVLGQGAAVIGTYSDSDTSYGACIFNSCQAAGGAYYAETRGIPNTAGIFEKLANPGSTGDWIFLAITHFPAVGCIPAMRITFTSGGLAYLTVGAKSENTGKKVSLGIPGQPFITATGGLDAAEYIVINKSKTVDQLTQIYARTKTRMSARGITVV